MRIECVSTAPLQVGAVTWPEGAMLTVIVKISLVADARGELLVSTAPAPMTLERPAADGAVLYPSDFAPYKPAVDFVVVGPDACVRAGAVALACGAWTKRAAEGAEVGPRAMPDAGDPSAPTTVQAWSAGTLHFTRFQCAPEDQRLDVVTLPFRFGYARSGVEFVADVRCAAPEAAVFRGAGWGAAEDVRLTLDTIAVAPSEKRIDLTWRGAVTVAVGGAATELLAVALGPLRAHTPATIASWPRKRLVFPADVRPLVPASKNLFSDATVSAVVRPGPALPFAAASGASEPFPESRGPGFDPRDLARAAVQVATEWQDSTISVRVPPIAAKPDRVVEAAPSSFDYANPPKPLANPKPSTVQAERPPQPAEATLEAFPLERCARIAASIANKPGDRERILAEEKVSPAKWAEFDAHWSEETAGAAKRGDVGPQRKYDDEYVAQLEKERGPIGPTEWALLVVGKERGTVGDVLAALGLPKEGLVRIERIWLRKVTSDLKLAKAVNRAAADQRAK